MSLTLTTAPAIEPISVEEAKCQIGIDHNDDDLVISRRITAVRQWLEKQLWSAFITQTWTLRVRCWPDYFVLPPGHLQSVTSITYLDTSGDSQTLATSEYDVNIYDVPGVVRPSETSNWPDLQEIDNAVTVTYVVGYGDARSDVPQPIKDALLLAVDHMYCHGDIGSVLDAVWPMLAGYQVVSAKGLEFVS